MRWDGFASALQTNTLIWLALRTFSCDDIELSYSMDTLFCNGIGSRYLNGTLMLLS